MRRVSDRCARAVRLESTRMSVEPLAASAVQLDAIVKQALQPSSCVRQAPIRADRILAARAAAAGVPPARSALQEQSCPCAAAQAASAALHARAHAPIAQVASIRSRLVQPRAPMRAQATTRRSARLSNSGVVPASLLLAPARARALAVAPEPFSRAAAKISVIAVQLATTARQGRVRRRFVQLGAIAAHPVATVVAPARPVPPAPPASLAQRL